MSKRKYSEIVKPKVQQANYLCKFNVSKTKYSGNEFHQWRECGVEESIRRDTFAEDFHRIASAAGQRVPAKDDYLRVEQA